MWANFAYFIDYRYPKGSAFYASPKNIKSKLFCVYASQLTNNRKSKPLVFYTLVNNTFLYFIIKYILFKKKKVYIYIYYRHK
jgi:hypothetical protein